MMTVKQVADKLAVNPETVRRLIKANRLKATIFGTEKKATYRIDEKDLQAFIDGSAAPNVSEA
jgi:excisionase family DNA binding protein